MRPCTRITHLEERLSAGPEGVHGQEGGLLRQPGVVGGQSAPVGGLTAGRQPLLVRQPAQLPQKLRHKLCHESAENIIP